MALDDILAAITAEADAEITRVDQAAREKVEAIRRRAEEEANRAEAAASSVLDDDAKRARAQVVNRARLAVERRVSATAEEIYQELMEEVEQRLAEVRSRPDYPELFRRLFDECRAILDDGRLIRIDPADEALAHKVLEQAGSDGFVVDSGLASAGGLELATADGRRRVQNTFESRTWRADRALRSLAATLVPPLGGV